jgi:ubiquinone/menaquinone biosynthesis C-methylase UbiE
MKRITLAGIWTPSTYDRLSKYYDSLAGLFFRSAEAAQERALLGLSSGSILDVGCGTGTLLARAHAQGLACHGLDTSVGMLQQTTSKVPEAALARGSFYRMPFSDECFDIVVETNALGGVGIDVPVVLAEMLRVCKTGGEVRIVDYAPPPKETWTHRLFRVLGILLGDEPQDFRGILCELGCEVEVEVVGGHGMYQCFRAMKSGDARERSIA